ARPDDPVQPPQRLRAVHPVEGTADHRQEEHAEAGPEVNRGAFPEVDGAARSGGLLPGDTYRMLSATRPRVNHGEAVATTFPSSGHTPSTPIQWRAGGTAPGRCRRRGRTHDRTGTDTHSPCPSAPWPCGDWLPPSRACRRASRWG